MGIRDFLFGKKESGQAAQNHPPEVRAELIEVATEGLFTILAESFIMMNVEPQSVPLTGSTGDLRSRGYIWGLANAIMRQFSEMNPTDREHATLLANAFRITYGLCDPNFVLEAINSVAAREPDALAGVFLASRDVHAAYSDQPFITTSGFWLLNSGDEEAIRYNLQSL